MRSTLSRLEELWKELEEGQHSDYIIQLKDNSLSAIQIAAIRRVYAYNGADLEIIKVGRRDKIEGEEENNVQLLKVNPRGCIPRVIERLRQKLAQWSEERTLLIEVGMINDQGSRRRINNDGQGGG